jgi:probable phosphoglycerate mutase
LHTRERSEVPVSPDPLAPFSAGPEGIVVLLRHGRTAWNVEGRFLGRTDVPLDEGGRRQLAGLAPLAGRFDAVYTSPLSRAAETARALAPPEPIADAALVEADQGELEGLYTAEGMARWPAFFEAFARDAGAVRIPGGETLGEVRDRMRGALDRIGAAHPGRRIAIVAHQLAVASLVASVAGTPPAGWRRWRLEHTEGFVLRPVPGGWEVAGRLAPCEIPP